MLGPPKDVEGECSARLICGDDYGDNSTTFRCKLEPGHKEQHKEEFERTVGGKTGKVCITWDLDEREQDEEDS